MEMNKPPISLFIYKLIVRANFSPKWRLSWAQWSSLYVLPAKNVKIRDPSHLTNSYKWILIIKQNLEKFTESLEQRREKIITICCIQVYFR